MVQTTGSIGDWVAINTFEARIGRLDSLPMMVSTPKRFINRIGSVIICIEWPS
jgi:hypothetical protein